MAERQQERAELVKWLRLHKDGRAEAAARLLEEDGKEIERLHHIRDKARQTGSAPYGWYAEMAEHVDKLVDRAEKAEAELARIRKEQVPEGWRLVKDSTHDERSFPEDREHENGNYYCSCAACGRQFTGYKRRLACKVCLAHPVVRNPEDVARERADLDRVLAALSPSSGDSQ
jgi:hypothetical protein